MLFQKTVLKTRGAFCRGRRQQESSQRPLQVTGKKQDPRVSGRRDASHHAPRQGGEGLPLNGGNPVFSVLVPTSITKEATEPATGQEQSTGQLSGLPSAAGKGLRPPDDKSLLRLPRRQIIAFPLMDAKTSIERLPPRRVATA